MSTDSTARSPDRRRGRAAVRAATRCRRTTCRASRPSCRSTRPTRTGTPTRGSTSAAGDPVVASSVDARQVRLDDGGPVAYGQLVLATGARPRTLGAARRRPAGVHTLRTIGRQRQAARRAGRGTSGRCHRRRMDRPRGAPRPRGPPAVRHRAGVRGAAVAAGARRAAGPATSPAAPAQRGRPADGRLGRRPSRPRPSGWRRVGDEVVAADMVVVGGRRQPQHRAGRQTRDSRSTTASLVDEHLRTSDPRILAAGDVANAHNTPLGRRLRVEHWDNAIRQGRLAASTVLAPARALRLAAVLLHRPVRPRHGVRRPRPTLATRW